MFLASMSNYIFLDYILCQETMEGGGRRQGGTINNEIFLFVFIFRESKQVSNQYINMCLIISARGWPLPPPPKKKDVELISH